MNSEVAKIDTTTGSAMAPVDTVGDIMLNAPLLQEIGKLANVMAENKVTVPKHLQGQPNDCYAVVLQAIQWRMNPFAVAQKTHIVNGALGYEAQLVNAVVQNLGLIDGHFHYDFRGEGNDLECRVGAILKGDSDITWGEWLKSGDVATKNSPLWKTNPKQQLGYLQLKNFARLYCPGAMLGVYTVDELREIPPEREIGPGADGPKTSDLNAEILGKKNGDEPLKDEQPTPPKQSAKKPASPKQDVPVWEQEHAPDDADSPADEPLTYARITDAINKAKDLEALSVVGNYMIPEFLGAEEGNSQFADELRAAYAHRKEQLKAIKDEAAGNK